MAQGWIAGFLGGREQQIAEPLAFVGDTLLRREAIGWAGRESVIVVCVSGALALIGWLGSQLTEQEPAVLAASLVLLAYFAHVAWKLPEMLQLAWLAWRLRLSPHRLGLLVLHRAVLVGMRHVENVAESLVGPSWTGRRALSLAVWWKGASHERVAWRIAEATAPLLWPHALRVAALGLAPLLLVIAMFRVTVTHGMLLNEAAHLGVLDAAVYPFAALVDLLGGTNWRAILKGL
jgi:hypothetical protein